MKIGNNDYKTILLDTNAIREIVTNENNSGKGFLENFMVSGKYVPCVSLYNVIELKPYADIYDKFLDYFSLIPCFALYPVKSILAKELNALLNNTEFVIDNTVANAFSPFGNDITFNCRLFFDKLMSEKSYLKLLLKKFKNYLKLQLFGKIKEKKP